MMRFRLRPCDESRHVLQAASSPLRTRLLHAGLLALVLSCGCVPGSQDSLLTFVLPEEGTFESTTEACTLTRSTEPVPGIGIFTNVSCSFGTFGTVVRRLEFATEQQTVTLEVERLCPQSFGFGEGGIHDQLVTGGGPPRKIELQGGVVTGRFDIIAIDEGSPCGGPQLFRVVGSFTSPTSVEGAVLIFRPAQIPADMSLLELVANRIANMEELNSIGIYPSLLGSVFVDPFKAESGDGDAG